MNGSAGGTGIRITRLHPAFGRDRAKVVHVFSERGYEFTALASFRDKRLRVGNILDEDEIIELRDAVRAWERGAKQRRSDRRARIAERAQDRPNAGTITALEPGLRGRVMVYLDGAYALTLGTLEVEDRGVIIGRSLDADEVAELKSGHELGNVSERIDKMTAYRPRTAAEVRERLSRAGYDPALVELEIARRLETNYGVYNDEAFVAWFAAARGARKGKDYFLLVPELRHLGVSREAIEAGRAAFADEGHTDALEVAERKAARGLDLDDPESRQKFIRRLAAKGFRYDEAKAALTRLLEAAEAEAETEAEAEVSEASDPGADVLELEADGPEE
jgi:SOS response regulatory protein OraA/RecX